MVIRNPSRMASSRTLDPVGRQRTLRKPMEEVPTKSRQLTIVAANTVASAPRASDHQTQPQQNNHSLRPILQLQTLLRLLHPHTRAQLPGQMSQQQLVRHPGQKSCPEWVWGLQYRLPSPRLRGLRCCCRCWDDLVPIPIRQREGAARFSVQARAGLRSALRFPAGSNCS